MAMPKSDFQDCFQKWKRRWNRCVASQVMITQSNSVTKSCRILDFATIRQGSGKPLLKFTTMATNRSGVPQGFALGPSLFLGALRQLDRFKDTLVKARSNKELLPLNYDIFVAPGFYKSIFKVVVLAYALIDFLYFDVRNTCQIGRHNSIQGHPVCQDPDHDIDPEWVSSALTAGSGSLADAYTKPAETAYKRRILGDCFIYDISRREGTYW
ncbi:hypothetical protein J6590_040198 [Homalodisca vitripennis]|nr:hypothetical protein J6590_040198 [Homalodisca vitripennis]